MLCKATIPGSRGVVVSQHRRASEAGAEVLHAGGNAIDAALTTAFSLGVVEPWMSGIGAGGYLLVGRRGETPSLIDFNLRSPGGIRQEDYPLVEGRSNDMFSWPLVKDERNTRGGLSVCAPTMVAGMELAWKKFGSLPWDMLLEPSIELIHEGIQVDWYTQLVLSSVAKDLRHEPAARAVFLDEDGIPLTTRWTALAQPPLDMGALPDTLSVIAKEGSKAVTRGDIMHALVKDISDRGGVLTAKDFVACQPQLTTPTSIWYRNSRVWSTSGLSGGETLMQILNQLGHTNLPADIQGQFYCALTDAIAMALKTRMATLGDRNTLGNSQSCTTHFNVADADGLVVSATLTLVSMFGSKVLSPQTGIMLNNGISWFDPVPGHPNSIGPNKFCLNNVAPTLVDMPGHEMIALGAAGGRKIIPAITQLVAFLIDGGLPLEAAFHQSRLDVHSDRTIIVDERLSEQIQSLLRNCGQVHTAATTVFPHHFGILGALKLTDDAIEAMPDVASPWAAAICG